jgi:DNA mismatch endonuclease (patch repair protein)
MDRLTKEQRSKNMRAIKSKDSKHELLMRKALWENGLRGFRKKILKTISKN